MGLYSENFYASSDGLSLYYRDYAGPPGSTPVLCIPGLTRNCRDFEFIAAHMARSRRVLCADLRGRGRSASDPNWCNYTVFVERNDITRLLAVAAIPRVVVLGTSRGAIVAMALAGAQRDSLAGVILNDLGTELDAVGLERIMALVGQNADFANWEAAAHSLKIAHQVRFIGVDAGGWERFARAIYREKNGRIVPDYDLNLGLAMRDGASNGRPAQAGTVNLWPLFTALSDLPMLLLRGENSDLLSAQTAWNMKGVKPDLVIATIKGRGHVPFLDEPEAIAAIDAFLGRIDLEGDP
jgi:pimeloyl-ACP methyl ester carboxylesterase